MRSGGRGFSKLEIAMNIHSRLKSRIAAASLGVFGMATAAEAMPRIDVPEPKASPVADWANKADPYYDYGTQTFDTMQFRPKIDKPLSQSASKEFNRLYDQNKAELENGRLALSQLAILGHTVRGLLDDASKDNVGERLSLANTLISSFAADPESFLETGSDLYLSSQGRTLDDIQKRFGYDESGTVRPPETKAYAKLALEEQQVYLKGQGLALEGLSSALQVFSELKPGATLADLLAARKGIDLSLEQCPSMDEAISASFTVAPGNDQGNSISLKR
jgi:hypothetical protein